MDPMAAARFNLFWFAWLLAPALIMFAAAYRRRRMDLVLGILFSLSATFVLSNMAVSEKWEIRREIAVTDDEMDRASADGANLAFTLLVFAPLEAVVFTTIWGVIGWRFGPRARKTLESRA